MVAQFTAILTQLIFSGKQIIEQAKPIINQLVSDLINHTGSASSIVSQAVSQLSALISGNKIVKNNNQDTIFYYNQNFNLI